MSVSGNSSEKLHYGNVVTCPIIQNALLCTRVSGVHGDTEVKPILPCFVLYGTMKLIIKLQIFFRDALNWDIR